MPNDPQWGKRPNDGPPDLDEILRKLKQKLAGLFRGRPGPAGPSGPSTPPGSGLPSMPSPAFFGGSVAFVVVIAIAIWLATGFYIVDEGRRGVVLRLGKYVETTMPGPRWHIPAPFETVEIVNISQVRTVEVGYRGSAKNKAPAEALMLTDDENIVDVQLAIQYTLKSPEDYLFNNRSPDDNVLQAAETSIREIVGKSKMDFVLNQGRSEIAARVKVLMQQILDRYKTGINITTVNLQNVQPPEQVQASFDDAVRAQQDRERFKNEGQAYANNVVPNARGVAARLLEEASGYKQSAVATAQGDASRFRQILVEYEKAPGVTRERLYLEAMQQILSNTSKVIVDQKGGQNLLYLPLDRLMQMANPGPANDSGTPRTTLSTDTPAPVQPATPAAPAETQPAAPRGREALRSRDR